jgi:2-haloacid dehalogenase
VTQRWVTFDCYGTLVDWRAGMTSALASIVGERAEQLLGAYHDCEREVELEAFRPYREER